MTLTLTSAELRDLTGTPQHKKQAAWLADRGWKFERRPDGSLAVLRAEMERHMLSSAREPRKRAAPNLDALQQH